MYSHIPITFFSTVTLLAALSISFCKGIPCLPFCKVLSAALHCFEALDCVFRLITSSFASSLASCSVATASFKAPLITSNLFLSPFAGIFFHFPKCDFQLLQLLLLLLQGRLCEVLQALHFFKCFLIVAVGLGQELFGLFEFLQFLTHLLLRGHVLQSWGVSGFRFTLGLPVATFFACTFAMPFYKGRREDPFPGVCSMSKEWSSFCKLSSQDWASSFAVPCSCAMVHFLVFLPLVVFS